MKGKNPSHTHDGWQNILDPKIINHYKNILLLLISILLVILILLPQQLKLQLHLLISSLQLLPLQFVQTNIEKLGSAGRGAGGLFFWGEDIYLKIKQFFWGSIWNLIIMGSATFMTESSCSESNQQFNVKSSGTLKMTLSELTAGNTKFIQTTP